MVCVSPFVTWVCCAETAKPIEMPLVGLTHVGPRNHVLDRAEISLWEGAILGVYQPTKKHLESLVCYHKAKVINHYSIMA